MTSKRRLPKDVRFDQPPNPIFIEQPVFSLRANGPEELNDFFAQILAQHLFSGFFLEGATSRCFFANCEMLEMILAGPSFMTTRVALAEPLTHFSWADLLSVRK
jgi:hypothetical protein